MASIDARFVPAVKKGVLEMLQRGAFAGYPMTNVRVVLFDGKMHPVDSKDIAFQIAGYFAFKDAFTNARPCLLEPICTVTVTVPEEHLGLFAGPTTRFLLGRKA